tara:strand:+ start:279 stop:431 length:153 start_codon:yes stop_codon:yes gene_type:complete
VGQAAVGQVFKLLVDLLLELGHPIKVTLVVSRRVVALITVVAAAVQVQLA